MADQLQLRGGTTTEHNTFTGASKEVTVDTTKKTAVVHDGATAGGNPLMREDGANSELALGSASSPSLKWDANTGIYSPGADQVAISTAGTGRFIVDTDGNVGVGALAPETLFHVKSFSGDSEIRLEVLPGANQDKASITKIASDKSLRLTASAGTSNHAITFFRDSSLETARFDSSGRLLVGTSDALSNVSIGSSTTTPAVQVAGDTGGYSALCITRTVNTSAANLMLQCGATAAPVTANDKVGRINFSGFDGTNYRNTAQILSEVDGTPGTDDMPGRLLFFTTADGAYIPTERMRIDSSGNVGIGVTNPSGNLHIEAPATTAGWQLRLDSVGLANESGFFRTASDNYELALRNAAGGLSYLTNTGGASTSTLEFVVQGSERARLDSSGRLLLGASSYRSVGSPYTPDTQFYNEGAGAGHYEVFVGVHNRNDSNGPLISLGKTRSTSVGGNTIVQNNDQLGGITFSGADGTDLQNQGANIFAYVDGTPGANDMPGRLVFSTTADGASSPTERMRITSNGSVIIDGDTTPDGEKFYVAAGIVGTNRNSDGQSYRFYRSNVQVGSIGVTTTSTIFNTSSDYRLKENVVALTGAVDRLNQLQVHRFNFIADPDTTVDGFLAHEAQAVVPECVTGTKDEVDDKGNPVYQGIDQSKLVPLLTAALQEALAKIETLEARITALEGN